MCACDDWAARPTCPVCGAVKARRVPQAAAVNWGGLPPSKGARSPALCALVDDDARQRRVEAQAARREKR